MRRGYNGVGTTLAVKVEEPATTIESRLLAQEQMTRGQFDLVAVDHIGRMLPEGKVQGETQRMNEISSDLLKLSKSSLLRICEDKAGNKLLHIAGMRCSSGQADVSRDIPILLHQQDGALAEAVAGRHRL